MASRSLYAPLVNSFQPAFAVVANGGDEKNVLKLRYELSKFNATQDYNTVHVTVRKQDSGINVVNKKSGYGATGIILNKEPQRDEVGLYVEIKDSDIAPYSDASSNFQGWYPGVIYKVQIRLSTKVCPSGLTEEEQFNWVKDNADCFSEWSTVCTVKATVAPRVQFPRIEYDSYDKERFVLDNNTTEETYVDRLDFNGIFTSAKEDEAETLYSYQVDIYSGTSGELLKSSGIIYANSGNQEQSLTYIPPVIFMRNKPYKITLTYNTKNYYSETLEFNVFYNSAEGNIVKVRVLSLENDANYSEMFDPNRKHTHKDSNLADRYIVNSSSTLTQEEDEGRVALCLFSETNDLLNTNLIVKRASSKDNFTIWEDLKVFNFISESPNPLKYDNTSVEREGGNAASAIFYDYTIESGVSYIYAVQAEDEQGNRSAIWYDTANYTPVIRIFNSAFLLGQNEKQLNLKFDNTLQQYKINLSETKTDTLGSKYPVFTKNGRVKYRSFQMGGLISFNMDEMSLFTSDKETYINDNLLSIVESKEGKYKTNIYAHTIERDFREQVLEWLNDGEVKLYKSFSEGNMLVRLTGVSLTPNQQLGRLICTFTATAVEVDDFTYANCLKYKLVNFGNYIDKFAKEYHKLGQYFGTIPAYNPSVGVTEGFNALDLIFDKYTKSRDSVDIDGYYQTVKSITGVRVTFQEDPRKTKVTTKTPVMTKGFIIEYNGVPIYVINPNGIYEFDSKISLTPEDKLYIYVDEEDYFKDSGYVVCFDFICLVEEGKKTLTKQIKHKEEKRGVGQYHFYAEPAESIFDVIANKYFFEGEGTYIINEAEKPINFRKLKALFGICIEANPGAVFGLKTDSGDMVTQFVIGPNGLLNFYDMVDFEKIYYLGQYNEKGELERRGTDVVLDYFYYTISGTYKED